MTREELVDELTDAIDDRMDMDVSYSMLADACVTRLVELGIVDFGLDANAMQRVNDALAPKDCSGHVASDDDPKRCRHCGTHIDEYRD